MWALCCTATPACCGSAHMQCPAPDSSLHWRAATLAEVSLAALYSGRTVQQSGSSFTNLVFTACRPSSTLVAQWSGLSAMLAFPTTLIQRLVGTCAGDVFSCLACWLTLCRYMWQTRTQLLTTAIVSAHSISGPMWTVTFKWVHVPPSLQFSPSGHVSGASAGPAGGG